MDLDVADSSSPANGTPSLNVTRTLGNNISSTSAITDIISSFRPTKVPIRPSVVKIATERLSQQGLRLPRAQGAAASTLLYTPKSSSPLKRSSSIAESIDDTSRAKVDATSNRKQLFKRDDIKDGRPQPHILSLDYDDPGELLMTSESDETIQIYKVREGRHDKQLLSKKYGVKHAKFTHNSSSIVYASTKKFLARKDAIRYLTTHDNAFVRYFEGHEASVTCLAMHPGQDDFISCSKDNTIRLWNASTKNATGVLHLNTPYLAAFDPSGQCFAVGSPTSAQVLLYDHRNFDKAPFAVFDIAESCSFADPAHVVKGWTKLEFSNDGRSILLGTKGAGHFLLDSFQGTLRAYLHKPQGGTGRLAAGEDPAVNGGSSTGGSGNVESSGDCCFTPDGRYVVSGTRGSKLLIWDTLGQTDEDKTLEPLHVLDAERHAAVVACNPRFNFIATADQDLVFWLPDPHA
ncbi:WD40-repeat-containing domain protein [Xylariales sp. PMI_506]|nr:WD40-repeat-containing domain protein [Xylariales sp. PMI_506]